MLVSKLTLKASDNKSGNAFLVRVWCLPSIIVIDSIIALCTALS